jgi:hypothetical protein
MRLGLPSLALLALASAACGGDDGPGGSDGADGSDAPSACEVGRKVYSDAFNKLEASAPACTSDDECVIAQFSLKCSAYQTTGCGDVVHRDVAGDWDEHALCAVIDSTVRPSKYGCSEEASCVGGTHAVCVAHKCSFADD